MTHTALSSLAAAVILSAAPNSASAQGNQVGRQTLRFQQEAIELNERSGAPANHAAQDVKGPSGKSRKAATPSAAPSAAAGKFKPGDIVLKRGTSGGAGLRFVAADAV